jgi:hypothetical protein
MNALPPLRKQLKPTIASHLRTAAGRRDLGEAMARTMIPRPLTEDCPCCGGKAQASEDHEHCVALRCKSCGLLGPGAITNRHAHNLWNLAAVHHGRILVTGEVQA